MEKVAAPPTTGTLAARTAPLSLKVTVPRLPCDGATVAGKVTCCPTLIALGAAGTGPVCLPVISWPRTVRCPDRDGPAFWLNATLTMPLAVLPMVSQLWSLVGAKPPVSDAVAGSTGPSVAEPDPAPTLGARP